MSTRGPGHIHSFHPDSGWCTHHNCTLRDDGRLVDARPNRNSGRILRPGNPTTEQEKASTS